MRGLPRVLLIAGLAGLGVAGCDSTRRVAPSGQPAPLANSPVNAVRLLEWAVEYHSADAIDGLLTDDLEFYWTIQDSAGNPANEPVGRTWVLPAFRDFVRVAPGRSVSLRFDRDLVTMPDPRPGTSPIHHRVVRTGVHVTVIDGTLPVTFEATGMLQFHAVRGDSADVPYDWEPTARDPSRWWFDRIVDETHVAEGSPPTRKSFSEILRHYLGR